MSWLHTYWFGYEYPSLKGNAPEDITSLVIVTIITALVVPAVRAWWVERERVLHAKLDHTARQLAHIIEYHPDIPNTTHDGIDLTKGPPL